MLHKLGNTVLDGTSYTVDAAGNRLSATSQASGVNSNYTYDPAYQLTQVTQGLNTTESYSYDAVGNRLSSLGASPYVYNSSNQLTSDPSASFTYDNNGNPLTKTNSTGTTSYTWDFENRLTSVTLPGSAGTVTFKYDPVGRRIQKSSSSATTNYVYDGSNLLEELDTSGNVLARYTQGLVIDDPMAMLRAGAISFYETDGLGSVTSLSNSIGAAAATYTYDSYGNVTASTGSITNPLRYTGREFDTETNLNFYRARYYDPTMGRFISEDPMRFGGGIDFYGYVHNNPANLTDPLGLCPPKTLAECIARGLDALFPGVTATVGDVTKEVGGHWNFNVQLQFSSYDTANDFTTAYNASATGFRPPARFGAGPALHLENLSSSWSFNAGIYSISGTAHIDLYNPNGTSLGGGGLSGFAGHVGMDIIVGHLVEAFDGNIDPAHCPW